MCRFSSPDASFRRISGDARAGLILLCDHAGAEVPSELGSLGLNPSDFQRHIAYDIGAARMTERLAALSGAPALLTRYSRLVIDANRGADDPTLVMRLSDGTIIPGNRDVDAAERRSRIERYFQPYHSAIAAEIDAMLAIGVVPVVLSVHSFTPVWKGVARPWQIAILSDVDRRLSAPLIAGLAADPVMLVGDNRPYDGALRNDTLFTHATRRGLSHSLIEVRQDLIEDPEGADHWAERLWGVLRQLLRDPVHRLIRHHGSRTGVVEPWPTHESG
jgi:predicted N-formylglutamate amidohydrolase